MVSAAPLLPRSSFFDLDDNFHTFFEHVLNTRPAAFVVAEIRTRYFLKRQKAVAVGSVIDETRFQRRLNAGNDTFVDIAFTLFFAQRFDVQVQKGFGHRQWQRAALRPALR